MANQRPGPSLRRHLPPMVMSTLLMVAGVALTALFIDQGYISLAEPIELNVEIPDRVAAAAPGDPIFLIATARLQNNSDEAVLLEANDPCRVFRWIVVDPYGNFVQAQLEDDCPALKMESLLGPDQYVEEVYDLALDPSRVKPGDYRLIAQFWGHEARLPFEVAPPAS